MDIRQFNTESQKYIGQQVQNQKRIQELKRLREQINCAKKRRTAERILFAFIIFSLLFLFLDARLQLKKTRAYAASLEEAVQSTALSYNSQNTVLSDKDTVSKGPDADSFHEKDDIFHEKEDTYEANLARWESDMVEKPKKRSESEVHRKLKELGRENELIAAVIKQPELYPPKLLEALANNPEMAEFVKGYPLSDAETVGKFTSGEKEADFPLFLQWDPRWGYAYYGDDSNIAVSGCGPTSLSMALFYLTSGEKEADFPLFLQWDPRWGYAYYGDDSNIAVSGCGPTSLSMALFYLTGDDSLTPDYLADYSMEHGYYVSGTGTAWALITDIPPLYGVSVSEPDADERLMKRELDKGNILIASVGPGDFTAGGHLLVIYDYDRSGFKINDPNCIARSRQSWDFETLKPQIKHLWSLED